HESPAREGAFEQPAERTFVREQAAQKTSRRREVQRSMAERIMALPLSGSGVAEDAHEFAAGAAAARGHGFVDAPDRDLDDVEAEANGLDQHLDIPALASGAETEGDEGRVAQRAKRRELAEVVAVDGGDEPDHRAVAE